MKHEPVALPVAIGLQLPTTRPLGLLGNVGRCNNGQECSHCFAGPRPGVQQSHFLVRAGSFKQCVLAQLSVQVLQYSGPLAVNPGQFMRVAAQWTVPSHDLRNTEKYFPHDVKWHKGIKGIGSQAEPLLLVVRQHGDWQCRLAIFSAVSGQLLKELSFPHEQDSLAPDEFSEKYILVD